MSPVRVRQHVNPLASKFQTPTASPEWEKIYIQQNLPLHLDIGCARGRFVLKMAQVEPNWNFLGLEIREPLVVEANRIRDEMGLTNLHYLFANVNNSLISLLSTLPQDSLQKVTIQFPDPWFKNRHAKRRVVQPELVTELAKYLAVGGVVFLQSDIEFVAVEMCDRFDEHPAFEKLGTTTWLAQNPLPVPTEREIATQNKGEPVYRALFTKKTEILEPGVNEQSYRNLRSGCNPC
ncbi:MULTISPECIES: tRNA (guanosine(46)-N7)-methyltransferase TrmB [Nostocales]|uniref:tRNA (guanine-N(7)-)-methyltransferase n=1 Tax=Aphanizomenon flos-aquae FACHB-1040 TaxID=2692887 RepID=A0ABR8BQ60_APHFL|nr:MULTISPECIES: tRNA (guanosine(46)-N7)-methyltransferase TrmB [Nostocales]MBO1071512.1 tRNA (guanosine(46)-N7)-methyltransferase TrmB [Dolichospermum sp. DEX189]MDK2408641.1 tRNA (guanosine(46)-N7)-methyltransferase TrmB [Aphanizomenon sp. 202]MDK2457932.1 tRNA (guanosine(46)-N7)-methyltransferase TrmB [Aphanizomenon sp. PH219]QSV73043.1 MAG: tRNA (guanosine(46)-N7)-methyltransferase TrmB [Aphanizomenon flos-aquae KM1D3_PB]MBD2276917.1 tRNA (guanosine(46)-N7)-methyltransferase TrmB [Aphanizo